MKALYSTILAVVLAVGAVVPAQGQNLLDTTDPRQLALDIYSGVSRAAPPMPSTDADAAAPTRETTTAADVTCRMRKLLKSATRSTPSASRASIWKGELKRAAVPVASANPLAVPVLPAHIDTTAPYVILRTR